MASISNEIAYVKRTARSASSRVMTSFYWNVTGNGWDFRHSRGRVAEVRLPGEAAAREVTYFTGPFFGSTEQAASAERLDGGNLIRVEAERRPGPARGADHRHCHAQGRGGGAYGPRRSAPGGCATMPACLSGSAGSWWCSPIYVWAWSRVGPRPARRAWSSPDGTRRDGIFAGC